MEGLGDLDPESLPPAARAWLERPRPLADVAEFGRRARAARNYLDVSQKAFGKLIGRSDKTVANIEKGQAGSIGATQMERAQLAGRIVEASGCPPEWFDLGSPLSVERDDEDLATRVRRHGDVLAQIDDRLRALEGVASADSDENPKLAEDLIDAEPDAGDLVDDAGGPRHTSERSEPETG